METAAAVHSVSEVHLHFINLCLYVRDLGDIVGVTLSISALEKRDVCQRRKALSVDSETNCCIYCMYCASQRELLISVGCIPKR